MSRLGARCRDSSSLLHRSCSYPIPDRHQRGCGLIDAVGRRETNGDIDTYIDRHGVAGLATALTYAVARERGEVTHRLMADDLDISPLATETVLQALRPVVDEHYYIEDAGASLDDLDVDDGDVADDA